MKVISKKAGEEPKVIDMENSLENLQKAVGGYIDMVHVTSNVDIVLNDEGKLDGLPFNIYLIYKGSVVDFVVGDILIVGANNSTGETIGLSDKQINIYMEELRQGAIHLR